MESSAFPTIIRAKLMELKMYDLMNIFLSPKIMQMHIKLHIFSLEPSGTLFHFDCHSEGNGSIKKAQRKNLIKAIC